MKEIMTRCIVHARAVHSRFTRVIVAVALTALVTTACEKKNAITDVPILTRITISPNPQTLAVGATQQFTAVGTDADGNVFQFTPVWAVIAGGGTINGTGLFTAGNTAGSFANTIQASSGGVTATATVTVTAGPLATIAVTPSPATMAIGATQQFVAVGRDAGGNVVAITPTWTVTAGGGAVNATTGLFTAGTTVGTFTNTVRAASGAISGTATVNVTAGPLATIVVTPNPVTLNTGGTQQFTAVGRDAGGNVVAITPVWSVVNSGGTIGSTGLFTAGAATGTFTNTVQATSGTISGNATVIVTSPLATITVTPNPASVNTGATQQFTAVGRDGSGNVVAITPVWSVVNGGGTINAGTGLFTAGTVTGTFSNTVQATSGGISGNATVNVTSPGPATITVTPNPVSLFSGAAQQFTAVARDANGNIVPITPVWSVVNGGGSITSNTGIFTAGAAGGTFTNTVQATSGGVSGTATVTVIAAPLATITVTPNPATVPANGTQQFTAVGRDANGNVMAISPVWSVVNGGGTINASTGLFTAGTVPGTYSNTVRATSGSISGTATVNVTAGALSSIVVSPNPATVNAGATQQFTAVGLDASGNPRTGDTFVWSVINGGGTINSGTGLFTAGGVAGTFNNTVRAASGSISGTATVTVVVPPLPGSPFSVLANTAVACTGGTISGDIGTFQGPPLGSITLSSCPQMGTTHVGDPAAVAAYNNFLSTYTALEPTACGTVLTGTLAGVILAPGVYCFDAAATLTGVLTLNGPSNGTWLFKIGTTGTGALTGTGFTVTMAGTALPCNVTWWVRDAATMTDSNLKGNVLTGVGITLTRGTFNGNAWSKTDVTITDTALTGCQ